MIVHPSVSRANRAWFAPFAAVLVLLFLGCGEGLVDSAVGNLSGGPTGPAPAPTSTTTSQPSTPYVPPVLPADLADSPTAGVGTLPGGFSVSSNGSGTYSIPLTVPPGRAGMQPSLSLNYNSAGANGTFGVGFSMSGTSNITRCGKTVVVDGVHGAVNLNERDRFCLDGEHLVAVNGEYGADGTEYRTSVESFSKIVSYGGKPSEGPTSFKAWTKDGRILEYGVGNAASTAIRYSDPSHTLVVRSWALDDVSDRFDNHIVYVYDQLRGADQHTEAQWLREIQYTASAKHKPSRHVRFNYEKRQDTLDGFSLGNSFTVPYRVSSIDMLVSTQVVHSYRLAYEAYSTNSPRSKLAAIKECAGDGVCLPPTFFRWTHEEPTLTKSSASIGQFPMIDGGPLAVGDFDGNGTDDLMYARNEGWQFVSPSLGKNELLVGPHHDGSAKTVISVDHNSDGKVDLLVPSVHDTGIVPWDRVSVTSPLSLEHASTSSKIDATGWWPGNVGDIDRFAPAFGKTLADLNGDGLKDLVVCTGKGSSQSSWWLQVFAAGAEGQDGYFAPPQPLGALDHAVSCQANILVLDTNGDGADDLLVEPEADDDDVDFIRVWQDEHTIKQERVKGLNRSCLIGPPDDEPLHHVSEYRLVDVNGDGLKDVVRGPCLYQPGATVPFEPATNGNLVTFQNRGGGEFVGVISPVEMTPDEFSRSHVIALSSDGKQSLLVPNHRPDIIILPQTYTQGDNVVFRSWYALNYPDHWEYVTWSDTFSSSRVQPAEPIPYSYNVGATMLVGIPELGLAVKFCYNPSYFNSDIGRVGDFDGDGLQDLMNVESRPNVPSWYNDVVPTDGMTWQLVQYTHKGAREHIVEIRDGLHGHADDQPLLQFTPSVQIEYRTLSDLKRNSPYKKDVGEGCEYPISCHVGNLDVVSKVRTDAGTTLTPDGSDDGVTQTAVRTTKYTYEGGRTHRHGRGWLGFSKITTAVSGISGEYNENRQLITTTTFDVLTKGDSQQYPFSHLPLTTRTSWVEGDVSHVSFVKNRWAEQQASGGLTYYPLLQWSESRAYELTGGVVLPDDPYASNLAPLTDVTTFQLYPDEWGNVRNRTQSSNDGHFVTMSATFEQDVASWSLGMLKDLKVTDTYLGATEMHETTFENDLPRHLTKVRVDDANDPAHKHSTSVDVVEGNLTGFVESATGLADRKASRVFDSEGMYVVKSIDPTGYPHLEHHREWDGALMTVVDPNGVAVQVSRDALGRVVREVAPDGTETQHQYLLASPISSTTPRRVAGHRVQAAGAP